MKIKVIHVASQVSKFPAGRYKWHGLGSGQHLCDLIVKALRDRRYGRVFIDFEGTAGAGSSFIDEAFGGLIREGGFSLNDLNARLSFSAISKGMAIEALARRAILEAVSAMRGAAQ